LAMVLIALYSTSCTEQFPQEKVIQEEEPDSLEIYIPNEFADMDLSDDSSTWSYQRSRQSEHFIVFWGKQYGANDPNSSEVPEFYRVDIDDLLQKAESFYDLNIGELGFAQTGEGQSNLDNYKMMIFLFYQEEWLATGGGYDDVIGALWVNPSTCKPVGSTIAHEIGHSFQYQVFCDLGGGAGFRYGFGGNGGNTFWEQTAQWQAFQSYPQQAFTSHHFPVYIDNYNRHICHENYRYASYFIHDYWAEMHGRDFIGRLWREAANPEDPIQAYMRITGISNEEFNDEIYEAAAKMATWDIDGLRENGVDYIGKHKYDYETLEDGSHQVAYEFAPGTTGYNVIPLNVPEGGTTVSTTFTGMVNAPGYNTVADPNRAGWRYGYVALLNNGKRVYSNMNEGTTGQASFKVPQNCSKLWFIVTGAPNTYLPHPWDDDESNDDQWPYKVKFSNTNIYGIIEFPDGAVPSDTDLTYDISFPVSGTNYSGTSVELDVVELAEAFILQPNEITDELGASIQFYGVESDGSLNSTTTANGYGHWFDANGNICNWGEEAMVFSEFNEGNFTFNIGQYPGHSQSGDTYSISQAFVYEFEPGQTVQATVTFNITLE